MINTTQIYALMNPLNGEARRRYISKLYMYELNDLVQLAKVAGEKGGRVDEALDQMGLYRMYSAHDTQITNILYQLNPSFNFTYIKYASQVYFEVYR